MKKTCISAVLTAIAAVVFCLPVNSMATTYSLTETDISTLGVWLGSGVRQIDESYLEGNWYKAWGIAYEAAYVNEFTTGGDTVYTTLSESPGVSSWSEAFTWDNAVYSSQGTAVDNPNLSVYVVDAESITLNNVTFYQGMIIVGFNDAGDDCDFDDLVIALQATTAAPIPGTALMLGIGMLALSGARRKK